jgi:hypothetical protein
MKAVNIFRRATFGIPAGELRSGQGLKARNKSDQTKSSSDPNAAHLCVQSRRVACQSKKISTILALAILVLASAVATEAPAAETAVSIVATSYSIATEGCGVNGAIDPGEVVTLNVFLRNLGTTGTSNLTATLQTGGGVLSPSGPKNYGAMTNSDIAQNKQFTFTASPNLNPGAVLTLVFALQDGATTLSPVSLSIVVSRREPLREDFDVPVASVVPVGWVGHISVGIAGDSAWRTATVNSDSPPNAASGPSAPHVTDNMITSPAFSVTTASAKLTFRNSYDFEAGFDGAVLEISLNGAAFADILTAGGSFTAGGYNGFISQTFGNPLAGRQAWTGTSAGGFLSTAVNLPFSAAGKSVQLRWRLGTDTSTSLSGQLIDAVLVTDGLAGQTCPCTITCPANVTVPNGLNQCGAVVNFADPATSGGCGTLGVSPATGSFFPIGTTTITASTATGPNCSFTITVNDNQPPSIACPADITQQAASGQNSAIVNYSPPAVADNCSGVTPAVCSPASGTAFPVGSTAVTCSTHDVPNNSANCSFMVTVTSFSLPTPTATPAGTPVPTATPTGVLGNVSTRLQVGTGNNVLFAGFIIQGNASKTLLIRSAGPSLTQFGVSGALGNPQLELHDANNTIGTNDNWQTTQIGGVITSDQTAAIQNSGAPPSDPAEPAMIATLPAGSYSAIVQGVGGTQGVATVEVYDLSQNNGAVLANISTRGFIQTGDNVMIGGFIVVGNPSKVLVRATGPSLIPFGISNALANPRLELHDGNGTLAGNDDWQTTQVGGIITTDQSGAIQSSGLAPSNAAESAIIATLAPGNYTAIAQGVTGGTGVGLIEVFALP